MKEEKTENYFETVDLMIDEVGANPSAIITILQGVQERYHYLPREIFPYLAKRLCVSEARLYSVATFYENFSLEPKGKFIIKICFQISNFNSFLLHGISESDCNCFIIF